MIEARLVLEQFAAHKVSCQSVATRAAVVGRLRERMEQQRCDGEGPAAKRLFHEKLHRDGEAHDTAQQDGSSAAVEQRDAGFAETVIGDGGDEPVAGGEPQTGTVRARLRLGLRSRQMPP